MTMIPPICPTCGEPAKWSWTDFGARWDCCGLTAWGDKPLTSPDRRILVQECLRDFDRLWKEHLLFNADDRARKNHAYLLIRRETGEPRGKMIFAEMSTERLQKIHAAILTLIARHEERRARHA